VLLCAGCWGVNCQDALMLVRKITQTQLTQVIPPVKTAVAMIVFNA
jgi:hypothetical protein